MTKSDRETLDQLKLVRAGEIQDDDQVRSILSEARTLIARRRERLDNLEALYFAAEQAFLHGWAPEDERTEI